MRRRVGPLRGSGAERGVSTMVSYVLVIVISSLLVTGLLLSVSTFVTDQRESTTREGIEVVGQQLADHLALADKLVRASEPTASGPEVSLTRRLPPTLAGTRYTISVSSGPPVVITLQTRANDVTAEVSVWTTTDVASGSLTGGPVHIRYDVSADALVVESG